MRKIDKGDHSILFDDFVTKYSPTIWDEIHVIGDPKDAFEDTRFKILTDEQNQLCGYTEIYINDLTDCHIDHYKKRSLFSELTFEWNNLIAATKDSNFGAIYKDNKSGIQKDDYNNIFNPIIDNVEVHFYYTIWGEVLPKTISGVNNQKATNTIAIFNLNHNSLKNRRKSLIRMISDYGGMAKKDILTALESSGFRSVINQTLE